MTLKVKISTLSSILVAFEEKVQIIHSSILKVILFFFSEK